MYLKHILILISICFFLSNCTSNSAQADQTKPMPEIVEEVETLDSLNQEVQQSTLDIENSIESVEAAVNELSNF